MSTTKISAIPKFLILASLLAIIIFDYILLRNIKDMLIVSHPEGILAIVSLKQFATACQLPLLVIFLLSYKAPSFPKVALISIASLLGLSSLLLIMGQQQLSPEQVFLIHKAFYISAELFASFAIGILFWVLANQSFTLQEAKLAYPFFGFIGLLVNLSTSFLIDMLNRENIADQIAMICGVSATAVLMLSFVFHAKQIGSPVEKKEQASNTNVYNYLGLIFLIILSFHLHQYTTDIVFKKEAGNLFVNPFEYSIFMADFSMKIRNDAIPLFFISFWMVYTFGWFKSAIILPIFILLSTLLIASTFRYDSLKLLLSTTFGIPPKESLVWLMASQKIIITGIAPTLFITIKEMAFIALPYSARAKGKVSVDILAKVISGFLGIFIIGFYIDLVSPTKAVVNTSISQETFLWILVCIPIAWIMLLIALSKKYTLLTGEK